ncbi:MAG: hypothetical protein IQL11_16630, partial [Bacteroidales bacterium]|nr:hypothetical protein [Bacteroidales bacterium]
MVILMLIFNINLSVKSATIYVDKRAQGANNGTSWNDAYLEVRDAFNAANSGDEIWVAEGIYKPTDGNEYSATFQLKNGVQLYGGFKGSETQRDQRRWNVYITVLSGDLKGDDDINFSNCNDNVYHVVTGSSNATIDGFVIRGGYARGSNPLHNGAGMYNDRVTNLTISHCTFTLNIADNAGGGIENFMSSPTITSCLIIRNRSLFGGAIHNDNSSPKVINCILSGNQAIGNFPIGSSGGAICNTLRSSVELTNCTFQYNIASHGASISNYELSSSNIRNCIIWGGSGSGGNEIYNTSNSSVTISYSDIQNGIAGVSGGTTSGYNIINADPAFISEFHNDFRLKATSPCIDNANSTWAPADDIHGKSRPSGAGPDMGACEYFESAGIIYVDADAQGTNTGTSWTDAFTRLHSALSEAYDGRKIWVAEGTYYPRKYDNRLTS